ncbi:peptidase C14 caspase catalytic subunit p20, partial [Candidatus Thiomargarita nelsonii]
MNFSTGTRKKRIIILLFILLSLGVLPACNETPLRQSTPSPDENRGRVLFSTEGETILSSYSGSYALLIGESDYTNGWQDLRSIPGELKQVEILLKSKGFHVEKYLNLNSRQLKDRFNTFINDYGFDKNNRLLFFYSGHGETYNDTGYLVPTDAPTLGADEKGFWRKALRMNEILTMARGILAKHALFLFDSCFSGMVFKAKKQPKMPK